MSLDGDQPVKLSNDFPPSGSLPATCRFLAFSQVSIDKGTGEVVQTVMRQRRA